MKYLVFDKTLHTEYTFLQLTKTFITFESLFKDTDDEHLIEVAPYIFLVPEDWKSLIQPNTQTKLQHILVIDSNATLHDFRIHLQQFIYQQVNKQLYYFRIWDGYVLEKFLPTCHIDQLRLIYKHIEHIRCEDWQQNSCIDFVVQNAKVKVEKNPLNKSKERV